MRKYLSAFVVLVSFLLFNLQGQELLPSQIKKNSELTWYTLEEAEKLNIIKPKKFLIDVYTDWCGWCKKMDKETFANPVIADYLSENFYAVKFNAETSDTIEFNGAKYINLVKTGRSTHPFALSLLAWRTSYPSIVYFTEKLEYLGAMPGYKTPDQLEVIINFIGQDKFRTMTMEDFQKSFVSKIGTGK